MIGCRRDGRLAKKVKDDIARNKLSEDDLWFANISPEAGKLDQDNSGIDENRHHAARKDLKYWLGKVNLPYHSIHKFRH